jgi:ATP-dependent DNA helicase RecG
VSSTRRNPIIAEIFHRLDYIERRGSGLKKIRDETSYLYGYTEEFSPVFRSTPTAFHVILKNMNYSLHFQSDIDSGTLDVPISGIMENERLQAIIALLRNNPSMSRTELAQKTSMAVRTIQRDLETLKKVGKIKRVGGNRYGHWEIQSTDEK